MGRAVVTETHEDSDKDFIIDSGKLRGKVEVFFDQKGQVWKSVRHNVNPSNGALGNRLTTRAWYDAVGRRIKTANANARFQKTAWDGAGRLKAEFLCYDDAEVDYTQVGNVHFDTVIEQAVYERDGVGNPTMVTRYRRTSTSSKTGDLSVAWSAGDSRRTYKCAWYDELHRPTYEVDYGTNNGTALTRPIDPPEPNSSDNYVVTKTRYNMQALPHWVRVTDNKGHIAERTFDALARVTKTIENYVDGVVSGSEMDTDRTTERVYDAGGRLSEIVAHNAKGTSVEQQRTRYVYGTDANQSKPAIYRNDLLVAEIYPDSDDTYNPNGGAGSKLGNGADATYDRVEYTYDYA
jgi:YD repeat-containing protein